MNTPLLTIAVCTHNRAWLLGESLRALLDQSVGPDEFELLVVDNASTDGTAETAQALASSFPFFRLVSEPVLGLSHARNAALHAATADWVCFLDDDALTTPNYVETALRLCRQNDFACFGGSIRPWHRDPLPVWFLDEYESDMAHGLVTGTLPDGSFVSGGNMVVKKQVALALGGFDPAFGVCGSVVGYGEETAFQARMRKAGHPIGYTPELVILHYARPEKYTFPAQWLIRYKAGIAWQVLQANRSWAALAAIGARLFASPAKGGYTSLRRLCNGTYRWQNAALDVTGRFLFTMGRFVGWIRLRAAVRTSR